MLYGIYYRRQAKGKEARNVSSHLNTGACLIDAELTRPRLRATATWTKLYFHARGPIAPDE